jgi:hypothetical protein
MYRLQSSARSFRPGFDSGFPDTAVGEFVADLLSHGSALRKAKMARIRAGAARNRGEPFDQLSIMRTATIPGRRRINRKQGRGLAVPDKAPKLALGGDN